MRIFTSFRRSTAVLSIVAIIAQIIFPAFTFAANPGMTATLTQANVPPEAQVVQLAVPRDLNPGDSLEFTLSGSIVVQSFDTSSEITLGLLNVKIDALSQVTSTLDKPSRTFTVTSATPGTGFSTPTLKIQAAWRNFATLIHNVVAVAQEAEFQITANLITGDVVGVTVAGTGITQNFSVNTAATLTSLATQISNTTSVNATYSWVTGKVHLIAKVPGEAFSLSQIVTGSADVVSSVVQPNVVPVAQVNTITFPRNIDSTETISVTISGSGITQSYTGSSTTTLEALTAQIDALDWVNASLLGNVITVTAATPGVPFNLGTLSVTGWSGVIVPIQPNIVAVAQVDVISFNRNFVAWDTMSGSVNGSSIQVSYSGSTVATLSQLAEDIDTLPSVSTTSNAALKTITVTSSIPGTAFTVSTFDITTQLPSTLVSGNISALAQSESLTLPRTLVAGDEVSVVVNGSTVTQAYTGSSNATLTALNTALNSGGVSSSVSLITRTITLSAVTPGVSFTVSNLRILNQVSPKILRNPIVPVKQEVQYTLANTLIAGDTITGTIDGNPVNIAYGSTDTATLTDLASQIDAFTGVTASINTWSRVLTVTAATAGVTFSYTELQVGSANVTAVNITANQAEVRASRTITIVSPPLDTESITVGNCAIQFVSGTGSQDYDCSDSSASVTTDSNNANTIAALLRGMSGMSDPINGTLSLSGSGSDVIYTRATSQSGTTDIEFIDATTPGNISSSVVSPQVAVAQSDSYTLPRTLVDGDTIKITVDGTIYSQTFLSDSDTTLANLAANMNNLPYLGASSIGGVLSIFAKNAGNSYSAGNLTVQHVSLWNQTIANTVGTTAIQSITFSDDFVSNDQIDVTVNGTPTSTNFSIDNLTTLLNIATTISTISGITATASGSNIIEISADDAGSNLIVDQVRVQNTTAPSSIQANVGAVAQSDSYTIAYPLTPQAIVTGNINGTSVTQNFTTDTDTTFTLLAGKLEAAAAINASFSGGSQSLVIEAKAPGTPYTSNIVVSGDSVAPVTETENVMSGAQVDSYTFSRAFVTGEVLQVTIDGTPLAQNFDTDSATTISALAAQIDVLASVSATPAGSTIVVTASVPGTPFAAGILTIDMSITSTNITANVFAQTQIDTLTSPRNLVSGDVIGTTVNGSRVSVSFSGSEIDTLSSLASSIDALADITATSSGLVISVSAEVAGIPFTIGNLDLTNTITGTTTVNNVSAVAQVDALNLPSFYAGDTLSVSLNGTPLSIAFRTDTSTTIGDLQLAIDALNTVGTSLSGGQLVVTAATPGTPFTLSTLDVVNHQTASIIVVNVPAVQQLVTITPNSVIKKWTFRVTINGAHYDYLSQTGDDEEAVVLGLVSSVTASGVTATSNGTDLTLSADIPGIEFTYAASTVDITAPAITNGVSTNEILKSGAVTSTTLSIDEPGSIYFVLSGSVANTSTDITSLLLSGSGFLGIANIGNDVLSSFTVPSGIIDGNYGAVAVDAFGNVSGYHTTGIIVDNTAPIVSISTTNNQTISGATILISGSTEPLLSVNIDAGSGTTTVTALANGDFSGSVTLPVNATSTVTVTATDAAGNMGMSTIGVTQDSINPLFTITPSATITNQNSITFTGSTEANVNVTITGGLSVVQVTSDTNWSFSGSIDLHLNTENTLDITTTDQWGNTSTGSLTITQDSIAPTVSLASASGSIVDSATFDIEGTTEMNASLSIINQSGSIVGTGVASNTGAFSMVATLVQDTSNILTVTATDAAGNQSSASITVIEDSVANTLLIQALPAATNASTINIQGTTKVNSTLILVHSGGLTQTGVATSGAFSLSVTLIANQNNEISISSTDQLGNVATGSVSLLQDAIAPIVTLGSVSQTISDTSFTLTGTTEALANIIITGGSGASVGGTADSLWNFSISVPLQLDTANILSITASDLAGNTGTGGITITQDSMILTLIVSPLSSTVTNASTLTLSGTSKVGASIDISGSATGSTVVDNFGNFSINVALASNVTNNFAVTATDATSNQLIVNIQMVQDSISPLLTLSSSSGATSLLTYTITGTTESGSTVQATLVGTGAFTGAMTAIGTATGTFSLTVPLLANTGATLWLIATDAAGNTSTGASFSILQDNLAPAIGIQSFSGSTINGVTVGTYQFTTNEFTQSTFFVGTGSNVQNTLIWSGSTTGLNHSGAIVGIQPSVSYYTFVQAVDSVGNTTDSTVTPVVFAISSTSTGSTGGSTGGGGSSGGGFVSSGGGGGGGGGGGSITIGINWLIPSNSTPSSSTGTVIPSVTNPTQTQTGSTNMTSTGSNIKPTKVPGKVTPPKKPTPSKPTTGKVPTTSSPGVVVEGPGFNYAIVDKNYTSPTGDSSLSDFQPGIRFISASNSVKVRTTRNVQSYLVDILPRNSRVLLVEEKDGWGKISIRGTFGWVNMEYLRTLQDSDLARYDANLFTAGYVPDYGTEVAYVQAYSLNLRTGPGIKYRNFRQISRGEKVYILDSVWFGWVEIKTVRWTGFVQRKWLKK